MELVEFGKNVFDVPPKLKSAAIHRKFLERLIFILKMNNGGYCYLE